MNKLRALLAWLTRGRTAVIAMPYLWLLAFFLLGTRSLASKNTAAAAAFAVRVHLEKGKATQ